jgi:hypothetical protein
MTLKCDVFSFGVVLLEVVSGRRNHAEPSLLSHVSLLNWCEEIVQIITILNQCDFADLEAMGRERRIIDLLDPAVPLPRSNPDLLSELRRCIQIGLLFVQRSPGDRLAMSAALAMLSSKSSQLEQPRSPMVQRGTMSPLAADEAGAVAGDPPTVVNLT